MGECEKILKNNSGLTEEDELIVYNIDIKNEDLSFTYVQYEIYNPKNLEDPMSLDACEDVSIIVNVPVRLDENNQTLYNRLSKSGYNLFDLEDDFYNDICSTYTTNYGTDLTLSDRKKVIYDTNGDITMCQEGCTFQSYNLTTRKSQCDCAVQKSETITNIDEINLENSGLAKEFYHTLNNSNFRVLKCYKLVYSKKGQKNNFGSYIMSGFIALFIILLLFFIIKEKSKIKKNINNILKNKLDLPSKKGKNQINLNNSLQLFKKNKDNNDFKSKDEKENNKKSKFRDKNKSKSNAKKREHKKKRKRLNSNDLFPPKRKQNITKRNHNLDNLIIKDSSKKVKIKQKNKNDISNSKKNIISSRNERIKTINIINIKNVEKKDNITLIDGVKIEKIQDYLNVYKMKTINDQQMNDLEY